MISPELQPLVKRMVDYSPDPQNARMHDRRSIDRLADSLEQFGQVKPVVGWQGIILAGNGLYLAAQQLGWTELAVVDVSAMTRTEAMAFALADNRTAELSTWEYTLLAGQLDELRTAGESLDALGWSAADLESLDNPGEQNALTRASALGAAVIALTNDPDPAPKKKSDPSADASSSETRRAKSIALTVPQRETIEAAIERVKLLNDDQALTEGRCMELIASDYLLRGGE